MLKHKIEKFENKERLDELNPLGTLQDIGLTKESRVLDYGAGTGIFSIAAANIAKTVFAYDINTEFLQHIKDKALSHGLTNVHTVEVGELSTIDQHSMDLILLVTVFHEIDDIDSLFEHLTTLLANNGTIVVIEFHKNKTPFGPSLAHRISKQRVAEEFAKRNFHLLEDKDLGKNFYLVSFKL
ncbi:class I SAM-dependent methyltransferase [Clostridia bacterium]|nr:class I SAM-dependent methyltransferase [Clostridia bacterium]